MRGEFMYTHVAMQTAVVKAPPHPPKKKGNAKRKVQCVQMLCIEGKHTRALSAQAYTCHFNLIPVQRSLKPGRDDVPPCMQGIVLHSVLLCFALYAAVGGSGAWLYD